MTMLRTRLQSLWFSGATRFFATLTCSSCAHNFDQCSIICPKCKTISRLETTPNYFDLLKVAATFRIDPANLHNNFRRLQAKVHPDKFSNRPQAEQDMSADWSSMLNKAYSTLQQPIKRGEYMLRLQNVEIPEKNESLNPEFLMEVMEKNEEVAELSGREEVESYAANLQKEVLQLQESLADELEAKNWTGALEVLVRLRYFNNLAVKLKEKLYGRIDD